MNDNLSPFLLVRARLKEAEGRRLEAYLDSEGVWTIGYGHTRGVRAGQTCTIAEAETWLDADLTVAAADLDRKCPWWTSLPNPAQCGLLEMCFNLGWPRLAGFHKMLACLQAGRFLSARDEALDSDWARQLPARSKRIADEFASCAEGGLS